MISAEERFGSRKTRDVGITRGKRSEQAAAGLRPSAAPARPSKKAAVIALLEQPKGAAIGELTAATGWQAHSVRAALTGLRKEGKNLVCGKDAEGITRYCLARGA